MKKQKHRVIHGEGKACPTCNQITEAREHSVITDRHLRQPFYYSRWYNCNNKQCRTTLIMPNENKIMNKNENAQFYKNYKELDEQMSFLRKIS